MPAPYFIGMWMPNSTSSVLDIATGQVMRDQAIRALTAVNSVFPDDVLTEMANVLGGEEQIGVYSSSPWAERGFCTECGTSLFYHLKSPSMYVIATGTFDDPEQFRLTGEIYIDEKPSGYNFDGEHPRMTGAEFMASLRIL